MQIILVCQQHTRGSYRNYQSTHSRPVQGTEVLETRLAYNSTGLGTRACEDSDTVFIEKSPRSNVFESTKGLATDFSSGQSRYSILVQAYVWKNKNAVF